MKRLCRPQMAVCALALLVAGIWIATRVRGQVSEGPHVPLAQFAVANDGDLLLLPLTLAGSERLFVLDTGTEITVCDTSLPLGAARQKAMVATTSGQGGVEVFDAPPARLGTLDFRPGAVVIGADLTMIRNVTGYDIRGIIGMDFLRTQVVQLDFDAGKVRFLRSAGTDLGERIPLCRQDERPYVEAAVSGAAQPERFLIDTGSTTFGNIRNELMASAARAGHATRIGASLTAAVHGADAQGKWLVDSVAIGQNQHRRVSMLQTGHNLLGLGCWSCYVVTLDFPHDAMYLKRRSGHVSSHDVDMSGLHLLRVGGKTIIHSIDAGSPAAVCGLQPNDVLERLGDESVNALSMFALRRRLCTEGRGLHVVARRGEQPLEGMMTLDRLPVRAATEIGSKRD